MKIIVYKNGNYKEVKDVNAWEYENDPDYFITVNLSKDDEVKILHRALFKACKRIADKGQEYHEAKTAEGWKEYYIEQEKGISEETWGETPEEFCFACESKNVNTNGGNCWCAECGHRWTV